MCIWLGIRPIFITAIRDAALGSTGCGSRKGERKKLHLILRPDYQLPNPSCHIHLLQN